MKTEKKAVKKETKTGKARILNYRMGRRTQTPNQLILSIGVKTKEEANKYMGRKVIFTTPSGKQIHGVISRVHGNSGAVVARFNKGMPGQSLGKDVELI